MRRVSLLIPGITDRQARIWVAIREFTSEQEVLPTRKEIIARTRGIPSNRIVDRLFGLIARGFVEAHGDTYKALDPPHEKIINDVCARCRITRETLLSSGQSTMTSLARRRISLALKKVGYFEIDISRILKLHRSTVALYSNLPKRVSRNADRHRRLMKERADQQALGA